MLPYGVDEKYLPVNMTEVDRKTLENRDINDISSASRFLPLGEEPYHLWRFSGVLYPRVLKSACSH